MTQHPALFALAIGAFKSPAFWAKAKPGKYDTRCPHCLKEVGADMEHILWRCDARRSAIPQPVHPLQWRFGWPMPQDRKVNDAVCKWMTKVVVQVWADRFPNNPPRLENCVQAAAVATTAEAAAAGPQTGK